MSRRCPCSAALISLSTSSMNNVGGPPSRMTLSISRNRAASEMFAVAKGDGTSSLSTS